LGNQKTEKKKQKRDRKAAASLHLTRLPGLIFSLFFNIAKLKKNSWKKT